MPILQKLLLLLVLLSLVGWIFPVTRNGNAMASGDCQKGPVKEALLVGLVEAAQHSPEQVLPAEKKENISGLNVWRVSFGPGQGAAEAARLRKDPRVAYVEADYRICAEGLAGLATAWPTPPDDTAYAQQWGLGQIHAPEAWSVTTGSAQILVAVVDSGVQVDHPDLANRLWTNPGEIPGNWLDDDGNGKVDDVHGWHFFHHQVSEGVYEAVEDSRIGDEFGHGTHVAGIIAAETNNGTGVAGVTWQGKLLVVKVLDADGNGWYSDIAAGIVYAVDQGARVINLSLGGEIASQTLQAAVDYALEHNALVVAATGNSAGPVYYPAGYESVMAVAATDAHDNRAGFSNYGPQVDLAAPGVNIFSTWFRSNYFNKSGTSMAAPFVSGGAALVWSRWPDLTAGQVADVLTASAHDVGAPGVDSLTGSGRIDLVAALATLEPLPDLWVEAEAPVHALEGETAQLTIRYGNRGRAAAEDVWITALLPDGIQAAADSWSVNSLPPSGQALTQTLPFTVSVEAAVLTTTVRISGRGGEMSFADTVDTAVTRVGFPLAFFAASSEVVLVSESVSFTNKTLGAKPIAYTWDFGDGTTSQGENPEHIYPSPGVYAVALTASNTYGNDEYRQTLTVLPRQVYLPLVSRPPTSR